MTERTAAEHRSWSAGKLACTAGLCLCLAATPWAGGQETVRPAGEARPGQPASPRPAAPGRGAPVVREGQRPANRPAPAQPREFGPDDLDEMMRLLEGEEQEGGQEGQPGNARQAPGQDVVTFGPFSEPVELRALVEQISEMLGINIVASDALQGSVTFSQAVRVPRDELLELLSFALEQNNFTLMSDRTGFYRIVEGGTVEPGVSGPLATTRVIPTGPIRPSSLQDLIRTQLNLPQQAGASAIGRVAFMDDLGVIVITDTPRRSRAVAELVESVLARRKEQSFIRYPLQHVAASVARDRVVDLLGRGTSAGQLPLPPDQRQGLPGQTLSNLTERLSVAPRGNALIYRGTEAEAAEIAEALLVIDVPVALEPKQYYGGAAALQIAQIAERLGLGDVEVLETETTGTQPGAQIPRSQPQDFAAFNAAPEALGGGPTMVVDPVRGIIVYYGTPEQQRQLSALVDEFEIESEQIVIQEYKLNHAKAEQVADLINGLIQNQIPTGNSDLLPGGGGAQNFFQQFQNQFRNAGNQNNRLNRQQFGQPGAQGEPGQVVFFDTENVFVIPDVDNNQVVVKAPGRVQGQIGELITKLDLRRPQVFLDVQIVSVTSSDAFRLAFETQLINAGGAGGAVTTDFGLTEFAQDGSFTDRRTINAMEGLTAALIDSDQVPLVINALKRETDTRILSSPQLLVDDNEEATIASVEQQPTTTTQITTGNPVQRSFGGYEDAGTSLTVTPSISEGGYIRLAYEIELSAFTGTTSPDGIPPPKLERSLSSESVTVPGDMTIVVGGIQVDTTNDTIVKVPLLGDLPLIGYLFRDTNKNDSQTTLYVFITPRILRDPNFRDLALLTEGPQAMVGIEDWIPELVPSAAEISVTLPPAPFTSAAPAAPAAPAAAAPPSAPEPKPAATPDPSPDIRETVPEIPSDEPRPWEIRRRPAS